jgi:hypothetical protein
MLGIVTRLGAWRGVVDCTLGNPASDQLDLGIMERRLTPGHFGLAVFRRDLFDEKTLIGLTGNDGQAVARARREEPGEIGDHITAFVFGGLMAALTIGLEERENVVEKADGIAGRTGRFAQSPEGGSPSNPRAGEPSHPIMESGFQVAARRQRVADKSQTEGLYIRTRYPQQAIVAPFSRRSRRLSLGIL